MSGRIATVRGAMRIALVGILLGCAISLGRAQPAEVPPPGSTVLAPSFAEKLSLPRIGWPSNTDQEGACGLPTESGRAQAVIWLRKLLAPEYRPFATPPSLQRGADGKTIVPQEQASPNPEVRMLEGKYRERFTAAISQDGQDLMCARWSTSAYHFQYIAAQELIRLSVEPVQPSSRGPLTAEQAVARVQEFLSRLLNDSARLLNYCILEAESMPYGHRVAVRCADRPAWEAQFGPDETPLRHEWALYLVVHTDGTSFVLDVEPMRAANVRRFDGRPVQRWFTDRPAAANPRPTTVPAMDPNELQAKLKLLKELADQMRREREAREAEQQAQR